MMKNISLALGLVTVLALQGCGGGGSSGDTGSTGKDTKVKVASAKYSKLPEKSMESLSTDNSKTYKSYYILKQKTINFGDHTETTVYDLNASSDSYITYSKMTSTDGEKVEKRYDYSTPSTLNVYVKNIIGEWELTQVAIFVDATVKDVIDFSNENGDGYMINTFDPIALFGKRVVKNVKDIEKGLFNVQTYEYKEDGEIKSIKAGYLDKLNSTKINDIKEIFMTDTVHTEVEPNFSSNGKTATLGNVTYEFEEFSDVLIDSGKE